MEKTTPIRQSTPPMTVFRLSLRAPLGWSPGEATSLRGLWKRRRGGRTPRVSCILSARRWAPCILVLVAAVPPPVRAAVFRLRRPLRLALAVVRLP